MNDNILINKIVEFITNWQKINDIEYKPLPVDDHSSLVFNFKNIIIRFDFSTELKRNECKQQLPMNIIDNFQIMNEQDNYFTYYKL